MVAKLSAALCLHLPRTKWQANGQAGKRDDCVSFPETLNMIPYTDGASVTTEPPVRLVPPPPDSGRHLYQLTAVTVHLGGPSSGHFVTYRRRSDTADDSWLYYTSEALVRRLLYDGPPLRRRQGVGRRGFSYSVGPLVPCSARAIL